MNSIEEQVLRLIGEDPGSPDVFADTNEGMAPIRDSINDAIEEICMVTASVQGEYPLLLRENESFYRLDFKVGRFAWVTDATLISPRRRLTQTDHFRLSKYNPRWLEMHGTPQSYGQLNNGIVYFYPCPSSELIVELNCIIIPDRYINDYDRVKVRHIYQDAMVDYAVGEYYASRGDAKQALYRHNGYLEKLGETELYKKGPEARTDFKTTKTAEVQS